MARIFGHATLEAADISMAEAELPAFPRWPRRLLIFSGVAVLLRMLLKDMEMGWSRALQLYLLAFLLLMLAMLFGLTRLATARPSPEQVVARLGLGSRVLTVELDEEGLVYGALCKRAWSEFRHFSENECAFVLHGDGQLLHMIPKRAFSRDDLSLARALMAANVRRKERW